MDEPTTQHDILKTAIRTSMLTPEHCVMAYQELATLRAERDRLAELNDFHKEGVRDLAGEVERMRPVVEELQAVIRRLADNRLTFVEWQRLQSNHPVINYRETSQQETTDA